MGSGDIANVDMSVEEVFGIFDRGVSPINQRINVTFGSLLDLFRFRDWVKIRSENNDGKESDHVERRFLVFDECPSYFLGFDLGGEISHSGILGGDCLLNCDGIPISFGDDLGLICWDSRIIAGDDRTIMVQEVWLVLRIIIS